MSCVACDEVEDMYVSHLQDVAVYVRVGNGNVRIIGCKRHVQELIDAYRKAHDVVVQARDTKSLEGYPDE